MNGTRSLFAGMIAATLLSVAPLAAKAFTVDSSTATNQTFDVAWELMGASPGNPVGADLSGTATFEFLGIETISGSSALRFGLTLANTSVSNTSAGFSNIGLVAFGFGTDVNFSIASWGSNAGGGSDGTSDNGDIVNVVDVDPTAAPGTYDPDFNAPVTGDSPVACKDDPAAIDETECITVLAVAVDTGLSAGASDSFEFTLDLNQVVSPGTQITFSPFAAAYGFTDDATGARGEVLLAANQVPLPGTLLLLGTGLVVLRRFRD